MPTVPSIKLNSGNPVPVIGLGFYLTPKGVAAEIAYQGLKLGYRLLDTAQAYRNEEEVCKGIARWIAEDPEHNKRADVIYTTKVNNRSYGYKETKEAIELSIKRAAPIGYIDIMLNHCPQTSSVKRHGFWVAAQEAVEGGKVKDIGVSNFGVAHLKELLAYPDLKIKPCMNQLELHPWLTRDDIVGLCREHGIVPEAYAPVTRGKKFNDPDIVGLAKKYGKGPNHILLRWSIQVGFIPLPKTVHLDRLASNFNVFDFELTEDEVQMLKDKDEHLMYCWDPTVYPLEDE